MSYVACVGEVLVDFIAQSQLPDVGASEVFRRAAGGAVANVAVGIARLGGDAHFIGSISADAFGRFLLRTLAHERVNVEGVRTVEEATSLAFVARGDGGERDFLFVRSPGADSMLAPGDLDVAGIARARILQFGGVLLSREPARMASLAAVEAAHEHGVLVTFDPNVRERLWDSAEEMRRVTLSACARAHLVKLSDDDLAALGVRPEHVEELLNETTRAVIVTHGAHGASYLAAGNPVRHIEAVPIHAIDTTGAGDAAMAAIVQRIMHHQRNLGEDALGDAVRHGCAAGAYACLHEGAIPSLPTAAQVATMLARLPHFG
jgi:fructokinase